MTFVRRPIVLLGPAVILVVALALATNVLPLRQIVAQRQEIVATQARLDTIVSDNTALESRVEALQTPLEVERLAREELGYVRPGEDAYVVMDPTPGESPQTTTVADHTATVAGSAVHQDERGLFARLWDYMTGRDLAAG